MRKERSLVWAVTALLVMMSLVLSACGGQPTAAATEPPAQEPTEAPAEPTEAATEAPTGEATEAPTGEATEAPAATGEPVVITGENYSPDIPEPAEPVTVTWATWVNTDSPFWDATIAAFEEVHPNITIEVQSVPSEEMFDKLLAQIAAGNPPDTAYVSDWMTGALAQNDGLVALDDYIAKSTIIDVNDYVPAYLEPSRVGDVQYGLPFAGETTMLFYRTDRFEEAGLDPNHPPETWEEFQQYAEQLTDTANAKYGFAVFAPEAAFYFYPWLWQAGGEQLSTEDPNDVIWDSPEGQRAADFYANLAQYSPPDLLNATSWDGRVPFANGDVAMYMAGTWFAGTLMTEFPDATGKWASAPLPQDQRCATTIAGDHLVVFKASKNPEAAYKWIEWLSAPQNMIGYNLGNPSEPGTLLPPKTSLLEDETLYENRPYLQASKDSMDCAYVPTADQPNYFMAEEILTEYLGQAFYGEITGAEAVQQAAEEAEAVLQEQ
ncbi:MAG TPA: extracellular solute-binding protein [Anaerolineales bacterium]|nr:extracellular solute-binding protein [Anaerolineales bacterium]